jgi:hypothetical protein
MSKGYAQASKLAPLLREHGVPRPVILTKWAKYCPALARAVRSKPYPGKPWILYHVADVKRALAKILTPCEQFRDHCGHWLSLSLAAEQCEVPKWDIEKWCKGHCPWTTSGKIDSIFRVVMRADGSGLTRKRFVLESSLKSALSRRKPAGENWLFVDEAVEQSGKSAETLSVVGRKPQVKLGGRVARTSIFLRYSSHGAVRRRAWFKPDLVRLWPPVHVEESASPLPSLARAGDLIKHFGTDRVNYHRLSRWRRHNLVTPTNDRANQNRHHPWYLYRSQEIQEILSKGESRGDEARPDRFTDFDGHVWLWVRLVPSVYDISRRAIEEFPCAWLKGQCAPRLKKRFANGTSRLYVRDDDMNRISTAKHNSPGNGDVRPDSPAGNGHAIAQTPPPPAAGNGAAATELPVKKGRGPGKSRQTLRIIDAYRAGASINQVTERFKISAAYARLIKSRAGLTRNAQEAAIVTG